MIESVFRSDVLRVKGERKKVKKAKMREEERQEKREENEKNEANDQVSSSDLIAFFLLPASLFFISH